LLTFCFPIANDRFRIDETLKAAALIDRVWSIGDQQITEQRNRSRPGHAHAIGRASAWLE